MPTLTETIGAFLASREFDAATISRLDFWSDCLGDCELSGITPEQVDEALITLAERGRLKPRRGRPPGAADTGLAGSTLNRYATQLASVYRYARRLRILPRAHVPPTRGIDRAPERSDPDRYLRPEEVERLVQVARVLDRRWKRLPALITVAFHTGLRVGNLQALRWRDVDLARRTITVTVTKNGHPIVAPLTASAARELERLPHQDPAALVFGGRADRPFHFRRLWIKTCEEAGLPGRNFHQLRHGCGSALASAGVNQAQIMAIMGHRTLTASARYLHQNVDDKRRAVERVFS